MNKNPIIALVGSSGVGKTTLLMELLKRKPGTVFPIRVLTTRAKRGPEDEIFCRFVSAEFIQEENQAGRLAQYMVYAANTYGCSMADIEWALGQGIGVQAFLETSVIDLRKAGYRVIPIKVLAKLPNWQADEKRQLIDLELWRGDQQRKLADLEREKMELDYQLILDNSFEEGGLEKAVQELLKFIEEC